jgi:hypothetical protein
MTNYPIETGNSGGTAFKPKQYYRNYRLVTIIKFFHFSIRHYKFPAFYIMINQFLLTLKAMDNFVIADISIPVQQ